MRRSQLIDRLGSLPASHWDDLHDGRNPFVSHAFLAGLEATGCLRPRWGWSARHLALYEDDALIAAAPMYRKDNSHGEFVFDHAWAAAFQRYGHAYYPKGLAAIPYSPVTGPRLLARDSASRDELPEAMIASARSEHWSSLHVNFMTAYEADAMPAPWLARCDVQFHWHNAGWVDFGEFLDAFVHKRRKAIRQEREKVARAGYTFRTVHGDEASHDDIDAMHRFYCQTFADKGNSPALTLAFFQHIARAMPRHMVLILAERDGHPVAGAMFLRGGDTLYGRYWGSDEIASGLHFETCYYQGIDYCLREGLQRFEPGAQGEHKLARGFLPVLTHSRHWISDPEFAAAIAPWCEEERSAALRYHDVLMQHSPFRSESLKHGATVTPPRA